MGRRCVWLVVLRLLAVPWSASAAPREVVVDTMTRLGAWRLGGHRVNYTLGDSALGPSPQPVRGDAEAVLRLAFDFREPRREYVSAYWTGAAIPGRCQSVSFWLHGDASGRPLRLSLEDAAGRWFDRRLEAVDWEGWRQITAVIGDGQGWTAARRHGEEARPLQHPVSLRQIAVLRQPSAPAVGAVYLHDLRAVVEAGSLDFLTAKLDTGRQPDLFTVGDTAALRLTVANPHTEAVAGTAAMVVRDFFGREERLPPTAMTVPPGGTAESRWTLSCRRLGSFAVEAVFHGAAGERHWLHRFAVTAPGQEWEVPHAAVFGAHGAVRGFQPQQLETVHRLNRDAGIRWERFVFQWSALEPTPGGFVWLPPQTVAGEGVWNRALTCAGGDGELTTEPDARLALREAVTLAFRLRATGSNGQWQWPVSRSVSAAGRSYGFFLARDTGVITFTGGFEAFPDRGHVDFGSGVSAWDDQWHHVAATYTAADGDLRLYVDGNQVQRHAVGGGRLRDCGGGLRFGHMFPGRLDDVRLYGRALAAAEVAALAAGVPPSDGLVGAWTFDAADAPGADAGPNALHARRRCEVEETARQARAHGVQVLGILGFPPRWASTAPADAARPWVHKPDLDAWSRFVESVTRQFAGLVDHWELWNEPNIAVFWEPQPDPAAFFEVVKAGYAAAKRGNPGCTVLTPGLAGPGANRRGQPFLDDLMRAGLPQATDAVSIHPYRQETPEESDLVGDLQHIAGLAEACGGRRPLWITEWCWTTQIGGGSSEERSARLLARGIVLALGTGLVDRILWFRLHDPGSDRFYSEHNYGLCWNDLTPKPAYFAWKTCAALLEGAVPAAFPDLGGGVWSRCFRTPKGHVLALWHPDGSAVAAITAGTRSVAIVDLQGNETRAEARDGIVLVPVDRTVQFITGLPAAPRSGAVLARIETVQPVRPGGTARVPIVLHNPFGEPAELTLKVVGWPDPRREPWERAVTVPPGAEHAVAADMGIPTDTAIGRYGVTLQVAGDWQITQTATLLVSAVDRQSGPIGWWRFDEGAGTVAADASGGGHHGAVAGCRWVPGRTGTALAFGGGPAPEVGGGPGGDPGVLDLVTIPDAPALDLLEEVTIAFWIKLDGDTGTWQFPVTKFQADISRNYGVYIRPSDFTACFSASFSPGSYRHTDAGSAAKLNDGAWHHIAATASALTGRVAIVVDGEPSGESRIEAGHLLANDEPLRFGAGTRGSIDEVMLFGRALTLAEIRAIFQSQAGEGTAP